MTHFIHIHNNSKIIEKNPTELNSNDAGILGMEECKL